MSENNQRTNNEQNKSHGCLTAIAVLIILGIIVFLGFKFVECQQSNSSQTSQSTNGQGNNQGNKDTPSLLSRLANNNDIIVQSDLDLASLGLKCIIMPQSDIDGLVLTIDFCDKNMNVLTTTQKALGNVKKGVQVSFSISILDLGLSVSLKTEYTSIAVMGGKVSYFQ